MGMESKEVWVVWNLFVSTWEKEHAWRMPGNFASFNFHFNCGPYIRRDHHNSNTRPSRSPKKNLWLTSSGLEKPHFNMLTKICSSKNGPNPNSPQRRTTDETIVVRNQWAFSRFLTHHTTWTLGEERFASLCLWRWEELAVLWDVK